MKKPTTKKTAPLKQGKFAAVLKLRILPEDLKYFDNLLKVYNEKNYTTAIIKCVKDGPEKDKTIADKNLKIETLTTQKYTAENKVSHLIEKIVSIKDMKDNLLKLIDTKI